MKLKLTITEEMIEQYASISNDYNPIHLSTSAANKAGFPKKIAHGMLSMAIGSKIITPMLQDSWFVKLYRIKFVSPIFASDTLTIIGSLSSETNENKTIKLRAMNQDEERIMMGKVVLGKRLKTTV